MAHARAHDIAERSGTGKAQPVDYGDTAIGHPLDCGAGRPRPADGFRGSEIGADRHETNGEGGSGDARLAGLQRRGFD